jgi:hypothetical protein
MENLPSPRNGVCHTEAIAREILVLFTSGATRQVWAHLPQPCSQTRKVFPIPITPVVGGAGFQVPTCQKTERRPLAGHPALHIYKSYKMENIIASESSGRGTGTCIRRIVIVGYSSELRSEKSRRQIREGNARRGIRPRETMP